MSERHPFVFFNHARNIWFEIIFHEVGVPHYRVIIWLFYSKLQVSVTLFAVFLITFNSYTMNTNNLIQKLVTVFAHHCDPNRAVKSAQYMKNKFVFYGIDATQRKAIQKTWFDELKQVEGKFDRWELIREMWEIEQREIHYTAIDWLNSWKKSTIQKEDIIHLEWLIINHSWWDSVDAIASNYLGEYFKKFPKEAKEIVEDWRNSDNMWLNRSCLIYQLKYKDEVDFELLKSLIKQYQPNKEFFIQKAIGWSLRQYSKYNPEAVRSFIEEMNIQGLAKREATKYL